MMQWVWGGGMVNSKRLWKRKFHWKHQGDAILSCAHHKVNEEKQIIQECQGRPFFFVVFTRPRFYLNLENAAHSRQKRWHTVPLNYEHLIFFASHLWIASHAISPSGAMISSFHKTYTKKQKQNGVSFIFGSYQRVLPPSRCNGRQGRTRKAVNGWLYQEKSSSWMPWWFLNRKKWRFSPA